MFALLMTLSIFAAGAGQVGETLQLQLPFETKAQCEAYGEEVTRTTIANKAMYGGDFIQITQVCEAF